MTDQVTPAEVVAKYFFFTSLDEQQSFAASLKVLGELKTRNWLDHEHRPRWIETLCRWKPKLARLKPRAWTDRPHEKGFVVPHEFDLSAWVTFMTAADALEVEAVMFSKILGFADDEIARGLGVSVGTVRYRVGRGLRHLGAYIEP